MDIRPTNSATLVVPNHAVRDKAQTVTRDRKEAADSAAERKEAERSAESRRNERRAEQRRVDIRV